MLPSSWTMDDYVGRLRRWLKKLSRNSKTRGRPKWVTGVFGWCVSVGASLKAPSFWGRGVWCQAEKGVVGSALNFGHNVGRNGCQLGPYLDRPAGNGVIGCGSKGAEERHGIASFKACHWLRAADRVNSLRVDRLPCVLGQARSPSQCERGCASVLLP